MKMTRSNKNSTVLGAVRAVVIGAVCGAVLCAGLLALFAFGFVKASYIPQFAINPIIIAVSAFSAFAAGFFAAKVSKKEWSAVWGNLWASIIYPVFACGCDRLSWGTRADDPHALSSDGFSGCDWRVAFCE